MTTTLQKAGVWFMVATMAALVGVTIAPTMSHAAIDTDLKKFQGTTGLGNKDLKETIGGIVKVILGFLGILAVLIVLWAGFLWMTATGNEDQIAKAKGILIAGVIGLLIIMSAYAITTFVLKNFGTETGTAFGDL